MIDCNKMLETIKKEMICEVCGNIVLRPKSRFCSKNCYNKFLYKNNLKFRERILRQSAERYERVKDTVDYKIQQKIKMVRFYSKEENKAKRLNKVKELYEKRRLEGNCPKCGNLPEQGFKTCLSCRKKQRILNKKTYLKKKNSNTAG